MHQKVLSGSLIILLFAVSCNRRQIEYSNLTGFAQGSTYKIIVEKSSESSIDIISKGIDNIFMKIDRSLSVYNDTSLISRINRNENVMPDSYFSEVFYLSKKISQLTGGAFDITVGPLVKAWGFGPDEHKNFDPSKLDSLMKLVGFNKVNIKAGRVVKENQAIVLDVNAIAQGYTVDVVSRYLDSMKVASYLVEIGGEVRVKGKKGSQLWRIGIDKPIDNNMTPGATFQAIIRLKDKSLATSGNYRKFYIEDGIKYSHTIDPKTGYPAKNRLLSASIICDDCATADGIATACMVMGVEKSIEFIKQQKNLGAYFVYSDDNGNYVTWMSENVRKSLTEE